MTYLESRHVKHFKIFAELISYQNLLLPLLKINVGEKFEQFKRKTQEEFEELSKNVTKRQIDKSTKRQTN